MWVLGHSAYITEGAKEGTIAANQTLGPDSAFETGVIQFDNRRQQNSWTEMAISARKNDVQGQNILLLLSFYAKMILQTGPLRHVLL